MIESVDIQINKIRRDGGTQSRGELNQEHIADLVEALQSGKTLEPILVIYDGTSHWLVDGFHRTQAHLDVGKKSIGAVIKPGTLEDAQWYSYSVNQHLSLKRTHADKQRAVIGALKHPQGVNKSNVAIAEHCGVSTFMVRRWREQLEEEGEIPKAEEREVVRGNSVYKQKIKSAPSPDQQFKVISPEIPEYYGQVVTLKEVKSGDCYECLTPDGKIYPFIRNELGGVDESVKPCSPEVNIYSASSESVRERVVNQILKLPEEKLIQVEQLISSLLLKS